MTEIITLRNNKVIVDVNCLIIPELAECYDYYLEKGGEQLANTVFKYLYSMYALTSPYIMLPDVEKEAKILRDFKGAYNPNLDKPLIYAAEKLKVMYETPISRLFTGSKSAIDRVALYLATEDVVGGRDGSSADIRAWIKDLGTILKNYKLVEMAYISEVSRARGDKRHGIDELDTDDSAFR